MRDLQQRVDERSGKHCSADHYADDPWRNAFFRFIAENPGATFYHAVTSDNVNIVYCRDEDKGMWFLPGSGMGPLQVGGKKIMKEMIEARS